MPFNKIRKQLYKLSSFLGDLNSIFKGTFFKRLVRKQLYKSTSKEINKLTK